MRQKKSGTPTADFDSFMIEALERHIDLLSQSAEVVWMEVHPDQAIPRGFRSRWQIAQVNTAALRVIRAAAPAPFPLGALSELPALLDALLEERGDQVPDRILVDWIGACRAGRRTHFLIKLGEVLSQVNIIGYRAIASEAARLGWPTRYRTDLTERDLTLLSTPGAPQSFWWDVRPTGTDLYVPGEINSVRWAVAKLRNSAQGGTFYSEQRFYRYDGSSLKSATLEAMVRQQVRALDVQRYEEVWCGAKQILEEARRRRQLSGEYEAAAYRTACEVEAQANKDRLEAQSLKRQYS